MKIATKTATANLNKFHFEYPHGTTGKFFEPGVAGIMEVKKGSKLDLKMASLRRISPMPLPPMSMVNFNTRFFYVPMIDICPYYNELDARTPYAFRYGQATSQFSSEIPNEVPKLKTIHIKTLIFNDLDISLSGSSVLITNGDNDYVTSTDDSTQRSDITMCVGSANSNKKVYFKWTRRGRNFYKLLKQLGYDFAVTGDDYIDHSYKLSKGQSDTFSALPILAFLKVYLNFYEASQYINNTTRLARLNSLCHIDKPGYTLDQNDLDLIADLTMYLTYSNDYFTSSFVNPANGNNFIENNEYVTLEDVTTDGDNVVNTGFSSLGTAIVDNENDEIKFSQNSLNLLKRLTQYLRRHQVAGGRMVDRILAEYGISIDSAYARRSSYIDTISSVMNITPVLNTTTEKLGDYAGFGSASNNINNSTIHIEVPEQDGFIIAIDTIDPEIMYSQGYRRFVRHITKFDFAAGGDFDAIGTQAIEQGELLMTKKGINYHNDENPSALSHSFVPRGAENKMMYGYLTGDFIVPSVNLDIDGYFTDRRFNELDFLDSNNKINITTGHAFISTYDSDQYDRIFYADKTETDYIHTIFRFSIDLIAPYKQIYDEYKLEDLNGNKEVKMEVGGRQMN